MSKSLLLNKNFQIIWEVYRFLSLQIFRFFKCINFGHKENYNEDCKISHPTSNMLIKHSLCTCQQIYEHLRPWCWERLREGGEGDDRGWDGWMSSLTQWTWVWVNSRSWWWTGRPGVLQSMGSQRVRHDWVTELNWVLIYYMIHSNQWLIIYL